MNFKLLIIYFGMIIMTCKSQYDDTNENMTYSDNSKQMEICKDFMVLKNSC